MCHPYVMTHYAHGTFCHCLAVTEIPWSVHRSCVLCPGCPFCFSSSGGICSKTAAEGVLCQALQDGPSPWGRSESPSGVGVRTGERVTSPVCEGWNCPCRPGWHQLSDSPASASPVLGLKSPRLVSVGLCSFVSIFFICK